MHSFVQTKDWRARSLHLQSSPSEVPKLRSIVSIPIECQWGVYHSSLLHRILQASVPDEKSITCFQILVTSFLVLLGRRGRQIVIFGYYAYTRKLMIRWLCMRSSSRGEVGNSLLSAIILSAITTEITTVSLPLSLIEITQPQKDRR